MYIHIIRQDLTRHWTWNNKVNECWTFKIISEYSRIIISVIKKLLEINHYRSKNNINPKISFEQINANK